MTYVDDHHATARASRERVWATLSDVGGRHGWFAWNLLWLLRAQADGLTGGVGTGDGRPARLELRAGDDVDWWHVEEVDPGHRLLLRARTRLPGVARMEFALWGTGRPGDERTDVRLRSTFDPHGLAGQALWWGELPMHHRVFADMLSGLVRIAETGSHEHPRAEREGPKR